MRTCAGFVAAAALLVFCGSCELGSFDDTTPIQPPAPQNPADPPPQDPANPPSDNPTPPTTPPTTPPGDDDALIDFASVNWLDTNISGWAQTASLRASVSGGTLRLNYDKAREWPTARTRASDGGPLNGNCWIFVNVNGVWHAATFDWMRTGQTSKPTASVRGTGGHIPRAPLNTFTPRSGETYGFMVSTPARGRERTINERSNVSMVVWP